MHTEEILNVLFYRKDNTQSLVGIYLETVLARVFYSWPEAEDITLDFGFVDCLFSLLVSWLLASSFFSYLISLVVNQEVSKVSNRQVFNSPGMKFTLLAVVAVVLFQLKGVVWLLPGHGG